jgi:hypothetical protein
MSRAIVIHGETRLPHLVFAVSRRTNLPSFLTRLFTSGALWSHSAMYDVERGVMNEAVMYRGSLLKPWTLRRGGMVETPVYEWVDRYPSFEFFAVPCPDPAAGIAWRRSILGQGYDFKGALCVPWRGDWQAEGQWYCSEADTVTLLKAKLQLFVDHDRLIKARGVSPHDLWRTARAVAASVALIRPSVFPA